MGLCDAVVSAAGLRRVSASATRRRWGARWPTPEARCAVTITVDACLFAILTELTSCMHCVDIRDLLCRRDTGLLAEVSLWPTDRPIPDTSTDTALCDVGSIARARI